MTETARLTPLVEALGRVADPTTLWAVGLVVAVAVAVQSARRSGLDSRRMYWASICAVAGGLYGSHLLGLVVYGSFGGSVVWWKPWVGGKAWYGGLLGGAAGALLFLRLRRGSRWEYADAMTPAVALGYAIGRLGCLVHGDDFGVQTTSWLGLRYGADTEAFHWQQLQGLLPGGATSSLAVVPVQLFHSLLGLALCALLWRPREPAGRRLALLALGYGAGRFALEALRGDFAALVGPLSLQQLISLVVVAAGVMLWIRTTPVSVSRRGVGQPGDISQPSDC